MTSSQNTIVGSLAVHYSKQPGIRALLKLIPAWSSADGLLQTRADQIKHQRLRDFFDALATGHTQITEELIQSDDFLHCYFKTTQAVINTRRKEKIELFARMLGAALDAKILTGLDQYEELLDVLDSMSFREFGVLRMLKDYETSYATKDFNNDVVRIQAYWPEFLSNACKSFEIEEAEIDAFMERLQRTGLYTRNTSAFWDSDPRIGKTTCQFAKLCELVARDA
jgi:hypothetical protein